MPQGPDKIGVHLGHRFLLGQSGQLLAKRRLLHDRIVQLGVGVGQLHAENIELETLGNGRVAALAFGERTERGRVIVDKHRAGQLVLSEWRLDLLAAVAETGSLSRAAERLDVPYRTAWHKLKAVEEQLGVRLLETQSGGTGGGGSSLTPEAHELIRRFRRVRHGVSELVSKRFELEFADWLG